MQAVEGKVAFITGGGSGIGRGMATAFAAKGLKVAIADVREDRLKRVEKELRETSDEVIALRCDVTQLDDLEAAATQTEERFGKVHIVCNNAGIGGGAGVFPNSELSSWERVIDINLWGVIRGVKVFCERIIAHGEGGHFVNTASIMGLYSAGRSTAYCTTKFAVVGFSECLREDLRHHHIGVSVLCPFVVDTPIFYPDLDDDDLDGIRQRKERMPIMKAALEPTFVGETVLGAIQANEPYVFCDDVDTPRMIDRRFRKIHASLERQFAADSP